MKTQDIRKAYLDFFNSRNHVVTARASLVPNNDPTTLFTGSGMQPMISYLLGEDHPEGKMLTNSQICFRSQDIDDIGDDKHTTCFEMLGNWSLGEYFKEEQIPWIAEFIFDVVKLDPNKVYISCYIGNEKYNIPRDDQAISLWKAEFEKRGIDAKVVELGSAENGSKLGMQDGRIFLYDGDENWWSRNGNEEGTLIGDPCGPDSEMFYDFGEELHDENEWGKPHPASDSPRFFEIGNNVFMGYKKVSEDKFEALEAPNIDHGSGLERIAAASINSPDIYKIDVMWPVIEKLEELSGKNYDSNTNAMRVITDHLRGAVFLAVDGIKPSNKEQGYVMRRLMRRAIRFAFELGIEQNFVEHIVQVIANLYSEDYPEVQEKRQEIINTLMREEKVFRQTLKKGLGEMKKMSANGLTGEEVFKLYDTFGFPVELSVEEAFKQDIQVDENWRQRFDQLMKEQRERSQTAAKGTFKGGVGGYSDTHKKYHTATHLLDAAIRKVLGDHVQQRGSNITEERLRYDFSHPEKVNKEQLHEIEGLVNQKIEENIPVTCSEEKTKDAMASGAKGVFGDKYGETVKVYTIGDFSKEICGGPHVNSTCEISEGGKKFKITKESSSSAGVRRIKAIIQ